MTKLPMIGFTIVFVIYYLLADNPTMFNLIVVFGLSTIIVLLTSILETIVKYIKGA